MESRNKILKSKKIETDPGSDVSGCFIDLVECDDDRYASFYFFVVFRGLYAYPCVAGDFLYFF